MKLVISPVFSWVSVISKYSYPAENSRNKYRLTHGSWGVTGYTRGGQLYNTRWPKAQGCYKLTIPRVYPVTLKEPWVNLFVARATRRIPPALTGCVLTHTAWEHTGAASGAVAIHLKLKWMTVTSKNLPQRRRPRCALSLQCRPVKWTRFAGVLSHRIPRKPYPGQCAHLSCDDISRMRKAARNALHICWRSPLQIALTADCSGSWWKLNTRMENHTSPVTFQTYWLVI